MEVLVPGSDHVHPAVVVWRFLDEVLCQGDLGSLERFVASAELRRQVRTLRRAFPDLAIGTELLIAEGNLVAVHLQARGTHAAIFQGVPGTGRPWTAACTAIYRVDDGRISEAWATWDLLSILEQVGGVVRSGPASA
jgi:steroid delta-isomerase-like uncharacterized protein